jgi:hypothetical protein
MIADDIRSVALHYEQDVSGAEALLQSRSGGGSGGGGAGGASATAGGGTTSAGSGSTGSTGSGAATGGAGGDTAAGGTSDTSSTQGLSETAVLTTMPGIYGNQYELQIDVSRLPRVDQYMQSPDARGSLIDVPSDTKTVTYFVHTGIDAASAAALDPLARSGTAATSGLVRRQLDRAVTQAAILHGGAAGLMQAGDLLAPEVVSIEFQYYDGLQWRWEWDTQVEQALPLAIQILLGVAPVSARGAAPLDTAGMGTINQQQLHYYRLVVHLPVGIPAATTALTSELQ